MIQKQTNKQKKNKQDFGKLKNQKKHSGHLTISCLGTFDEGCGAGLGGWGHAAWWCVAAIREQENICSDIHEEEVPPPAP